MLRINKSVIAAIIAHAERELPYEACGYLAEKDGRVSAHYELTNQDRAGDHFTMDPREQFAAAKEIRDQGEKLCAVYHSHPETPARLSVEDIRLANDPTISYVIVSLAEKQRVVKSFRVVKGEVTPELLEEIEG